MAEEYRALAARARSSLGFCVLLSALLAPTAPAWAEADLAAIVARARSADATSLERLALQLRRGVGSNPSAQSLQQAAEAYGALVERGQELADADAALQATISTGDALRETVEAQRAQREAAAEPDEAALEALLRSTEWQRLGYARSTLDYWRGWALLARGRSLPAGDERASTLDAARISFTRSARALILVRVALASRLGLGLSLLELGRDEAAEAVLAGLEAQLRASGAQNEPELMARTLRGLAALALRRDQPAQALEIALRIPPELLSADEQVELQFLRAATELAAAAETGGDAASPAARLRALSSQGEEQAHRAAALAARHWPQLRGQDVGLLGTLLGADEAFEAARYAEARELYAQLFSSPTQLPGLDLELARYRHAVSLQRTGAHAEAAAQLESLLAGEANAVPGAQPPLRRNAAVLLYAVAETLAARDPGKHSEALAERAAAQLLQIAPETSGADRARLRVARARERSGRRDTAAAALEQISHEQPEYAAARYELVRLRTAELEELEASGRLGRTGRQRALRLAADLDALGELVDSGRLDLPAERLATLATVRARAASWAGETPDAVLAHIVAARERPELGRPEARVLLGLELRALVEARRFGQLEERLASTSDAEIRRALPLYLEILPSLEERRAPADTRLLWYARLAVVADASTRAELELSRGRVLLEAGSPDEAAQIGAALVGSDPSWGDAWHFYAQALERSEQHASALDAWDRVASGVEPGSRRWAEAILGGARTALRSGDLARACTAIAELEDGLGDLDRPAQRELAQLREHCGAPHSKAQGAGKRYESNTCSMVWLASPLGSSARLRTSPTPFA